MNARKSRTLRVGSGGGSGRRWERERETTAKSSNISNNNNEIALTTDTDEQVLTPRGRPCASSRMANTANAKSKTLSSVALIRYARYYGIVIEFNKKNKFIFRRKREIIEGWSDGGGGEAECDEWGSHVANVYTYTRT